MHARLHNWALVCAICHLSIGNDPVFTGWCPQVIFYAADLLTYSTVSKCARHSAQAITLPSNGCPKASCLLCQNAPLVYLYHPQCRQTLLKTSIGHKLSEDDWFLRFAFALSNYQRNTPTPRALLEISQELFTTTMSLLPKDTPVACYMTSLQGLPTELREQIFVFLLDGPGGDVLFYREALVVLQKLQILSRVEQSSVLCSSALFTRWDKFGDTFYLAGVNDKRVEQSTPIKAANDSWDHIVLRSNDVGITHVAFVNSCSSPYIDPAIGYVQVLRRPAVSHERLWITMEVRQHFKRTCSLF
jgi:hypothetical protein